MIFGEQSLGDYLWRGTWVGCTTLCCRRLSRNISARPTKAAWEVISRRFMNGRFQPYPRIKLDQKYRHLFDQKAQNALQSSAWEVISRRFMNGRFQPYPRIKLDQKYRHLFDQKAQNALQSSFLDSHDERLATSELNNFLATIIEVYSGNAPVSRRA